MENHVGLVLGATGIMGNALVRRLSASGWTVLAASRRPIQAINQHVIPLGVDLKDKSALQAALAPYRVTHVFFAAFGLSQHAAAFGSYKMMRRMLKTMGAAVPFIERVPPLSKQFYTQLAKSGLAYDPDKVNFRMLQNAVEVTRAAPHDLKHVAIVTGGKIYGMHFTPYLYRRWKQPFEEEDSRAPGPNFYFEQEDYLQELGAKTNITWSIARPSFLIGDNPRAHLNLLVALGVYASILKAQGQPLIFPGDAAAADCLFEMSDADMVAALLEWSSLTPAGHNQAFNAVNGNPIRWRTMWPSIASYFGMESEIRDSGFAAQPIFQTSSEAWDKLVQTHHLEANRLTDLVSPSVFDVVMIQDWDTVFSMKKARQLGFDLEVDNSEMFQRHFQRLKNKRIIP